MNEPSSFDPTPRRSIRKAAIIIGGFIGIFVVVIGILWGIYYYQQWQGERAVTALNAYLQEQSDAAIQAAMADTYGGSTPQETLRMYIDAVEKGDYGLASKYFIESKREVELTSLQNSSQENITGIISLLKEAEKTRGGWSEDKKGFVITDPILVDFVLYPNNIWKLVEI